MNHISSRREFLRGAGVVAAIGLAGCSTSGSGNGGTPTPQQGNGDIVAVGDLITHRQMSIVVRKVTRGVSVPDFQPDPGMTNVVVDIAVKNTTSDTLLDGISLLPQVVDAQRKTYIDFSVFLPKGLIYPATLPGEVVRGQLLFQVPTDETGQTLQISTAGSFPGTFVDLSTTAPSVADLSQDLVEEAATPGQSVSLLDERFRVDSVETTSTVGSTQAAPGTEFAVVEATLTNDSSQAKFVTSQTRLKDSTQQLYAAVPRLSTNTEIPAGASDTGVIVYEVDSGSGPFSLAREVNESVDGQFRSAKGLWNLEAAGGPGNPIGR